MSSRRRTTGSGPGRAGGGLERGQSRQAGWRRRTRRRAGSLAVPRLLVGLLAAAASIPGVLRGQTRPVPLPSDPEVRAAFLEWDRGDYHIALRRYLRILETADPGTVRAVAALTGEVHPVRELAVDGRDPRVGPDGRFVAFRVDEGGEAGGGRTRILRLPEGEPVATVDGRDPVFHGGRVAYLADGLPAGTAAELRERVDAARTRDAWVRARAELEWARLRAASVRIRSLEDGREAAVELGDLLPVELAFDAVGGLWIAGASRDGTEGRLARVAEETGRDPVARRVPVSAGFPAGLHPPSAGGATGRGAGSRIAVAFAAEPPWPMPSGRVSGAGGGAGVAVVDADGPRVFLPGGRDPSLSGDGSTLAHLRDRDGRTEVVTVPLDGGGSARVVLSSEIPVEAARLSPDGSWVAYQAMPLHDWEVFAVPARGGDPVQLSRDIQHDRRPLWLDEGTVLAVRGEGRHMRSFVYGLDGAPPLKLFHNNTVRTIAPEYAWASSPGGSAVVVVAERDGDTVSPERGVYLVDRTRTVSREALRERLETALAAEEALRLRGTQAFRLIAGDVRAAVDQVQVEAVSAHAHALHRMGSRSILKPGNRAAVDYLAETLRRFGYEPELQWFEPVAGVETANVVVRVEGTVDPELVYVVGTHFDSVERGPGADDNGSGTAALLEVARVLRERPLPATVELAFFTGEEAGLLGSRAYVRRAREAGKTVVGALNNDMVGWTGDHRLDNTIRYSNPGIRDVQHAAAILFSDLITFDALYYKSTDAAAFHEAWGDIVGGIGSYPVLGNPHYHRATDRVETVNHRLVAEVARTTLASVMLLASAPSRLEGLRAEAVDGHARLRWTPARESDVVEYVILWVDVAGELQERRVPASPEAVQETRIPALEPGTTVRVKARNARGHVGWDWAVTEVEPAGPGS